MLNISRDGYLPRFEGRKEGRRRTLVVSSHFASFSSLVAVLSHVTDPLFLLSSGNICRVIQSFTFEGATAHLHAGHAYVVTEATVHLGGLFPKLAL